MKQDGRPVLLGIAAVTLVYLIWAALHDISQGKSSDFTPEFAALAFSVPALAVVLHAASGILTPRG